MSTPFPPDCAARFAPVRALAAGGYGTVYLAVQVALERQVAVKVLHAQGHLEDEQVERFLSEARMTASLDHPHVVKIFDHGADRGVPWIAYELLTGETLATRLERHGKLSEDDALAAAIQVAAALEAAHERGIVHRDVKPENVMCSADGHCTLMDFGIGKWSEGVRTAAGMILGTPGFIAPEQIRGEGTGPSGDVYALGVTLYVLVVGHTPFSGGDARDVLARQVREDAPRASTFASVSPSVDALLARVLARDVLARPASARALREALEAVRARLAGEKPIATRVLERRPSRAVPRTAARTLGTKAVPLVRPTPLGLRVRRRLPAVALMGAALIGIGFSAYAWRPRAPAPAPVASPSPVAAVVQEVADSRLLRALHLHDSGKYAEAISAYREGAQAFPDKVEFKLGLGRALLAASAHDEAERVLRAVIAKPFPGIAFAYHLLSRVLFARGKAQEALRAEVQALTADPTNLDLHTAIAADLFSNGSRGAARLHLDLLKNGKISDPRVASNAVHMLLELKLQEAALARARAHDRDHGGHDGAVLLANVLYATNGDAEGVAVLNRLLEQAPTDADAMAQLARFHGRAGRSVEALATVQRYRKLVPPLQAYLLEVEVLTQTKRDAEAARVLERIIGLAPALTAFAEVELAGLRMGELGRYREALHYMDRAHQLDPKARRPRIVRSVYYRNLGRFEEAVAVGFEALALPGATDDEVSQVAEGIRRLPSGQAQEERFKRLAQLAPHSAVPCKALGQIYYNQSRFDEAREWFRRALLYDPKSDEAHRTLLFMEVADRTDDISGRSPTPPSPPSGAPPAR